MPRSNLHQIYQILCQKQLRRSTLQPCIWFQSINCVGWGKDQALATFWAAGAVSLQQAFQVTLQALVTHCTALHCTALHCTALHCTALHCTALHCTALLSTICALCGVQMKSADTMLPCETSAAYMSTQHKLHANTCTDTAYVSIRHTYKRTCKHVTTQYG